MIIYPAIDLKEGKCVRLRQGDYDAVTVYAKNPVEVAKEWERQGAKYLHLVDLDGARQGVSINHDVIGEIVRAVKIPVQLGGGIRTLEDIQEKLDLGIARVILGSVVISHKELVEVAIKRWGPERIVIGIDAKDGMVAIQGWLEVTSQSVIALARQLKSIGTKTIIYTDIAKDGMMQGPNVLETQQMIQETGLQVIASGGITELLDLKKLGAIGVSGAIIGKALYTGSIQLREALTYMQGGTYAE